ncbi:MAG: triphosphoribosyl-dephospho-CoA synthase, partial [Oscillospiraceae bacterium]|nr:triphosphoribosyl-dephospho-CoA synthase [Oscillospiraceae bacterium]
QMAQLSMADFEDQNIHKSFGKQLFRTHNIKGIRGQAAAGYPAVRGAYPLLCQLMRDGASVDEAGVKVLLKLLCEVQDTNIIKRSDEQTLIKVQSRAREIADGDNVSEHLRQMNDEFVKLNISPGGCADLLAICFLLYFIGE